MVIRYCNTFVRPNSGKICPSWSYLAMRSKETRTKPLPSERKKYLIKPVRLRELAANDSIFTRVKDNFVPD